MFADTSSCDTADVLRRRADFKRGLVHADLVSQRRAEARVIIQEKRELRVSAKRRLGMSMLCHLAIIFFHEWMDVPSPPQYFCAPLGLSISLFKRVEFSELFQIAVSVMVRRNSESITPKRSGGIRKLSS